ncbi:MAG: hypothetical protein LC745_13480, partial [Planctomycetia bacterium]|nr:hypothetical protein [Planctomycetia bacterium]
MGTTLSITEWKNVLKAHPKAADAAPLTKALEEFSAAGRKDDPEALIGVLERVLSRAEAVKKKNKDKELVGFLDDLIADAGKEKAKAARAAA